MKKTLTLALSVCLFSLFSPAQSAPAPMTPDGKSAVVSKLADLLEKKYVFPETALKMGDLIRKNLASGAEEFSYNLQNLKRATLVGETTGGGAHPVRQEAVDDDFRVGIPYARAVNPVSQTNWEGTGVAPDVKVAADKALDTACGSYARTER